MKPLTIVATIFGLMCILALYAGSASAAVVTDASGALPQCAAACKDANACDSLEGHDAVKCGNQCWCTCAGTCIRDKVCLDLMLKEDTAAEAVGGIALPPEVVGGEVEYFMLAKGIQEFEPATETTLAIPLVYHTKAVGNFRGMPSNEIVCDIDPFLIELAIDKVMVERVAPAPDGCMTFEDQDLVEDLLLVGQNVYDPEGNADIFNAGYTAAVRTCLNDFINLDVPVNSNACPTALGVCGCSEPIGTETIEGNTLVIPNPNVENQFITYNIPSCGTYPICDFELGIPEGGCCISDVAIIQQCIPSGGGDAIDCATCVNPGGDLYDDSWDYGLNACDHGDVFEYRLVDGVLEQVQTIFHDRDCPFQQLKGFSTAQKEWVATVVAEMTPLAQGITRDFVEKGKLVDQNQVAYTFTNSLNCSLDEAEKQYRTE